MGGPPIQFSMPCWYLIDIPTILLSITINNLVQTLNVEPISNIFYGLRPKIFGIILLLIYFLGSTYAVFDLITNFTAAKLGAVLVMYLIFNGLLQQTVLHRYMAHSQFTMPKWLHNILIFLSCFAGLGSPTTFQQGHVLHHMNADTAGDVHGPGGPGLFSYKLILYQPNFVRINDPFLKFLHSYYHYILGTLILILGIIDVTWMSYYCMQVFLANQLSTDFFNWYMHTNTLPGSYKNHPQKDNSHNNFIIGFISGEWHNNHHNSSKQLNQGEKWWEFDYVYHMYIRWLI